MSSQTQRTSQAPPARWFLPRARSIGALLERHRGSGPGFDALRVLLALMVFNAHLGAVGRGRGGEAILIAANAAGSRSAVWQSWREPLYTLIVPAFFALSGFLVAGSALRLRNVRSFLVFRALRIAPALTVEVTLSALLLGPLFTSQSWSQYFTSRDFFAYLGNVFGVVDFYLPGVFASNPLPRIVNNSLWTLPSEFYCYLLLSAAMAVGLFYRRAALLAIFVVVTVVLAFYVVENHLSEGVGNLPAPVVVYYFFVGCMFYLFRDRIPIHPLTVAACAGVAYVCARERFIMLGPLFTTYVVVALGMVSWPGVGAVRRGDYSYGIYLYHFPIAQALIATWPRLGDHLGAFKLAALAATLSFAALSWHLLEKPALGLKRYFLRGEGRIK